MMFSVSGRLAIASFFILLSLHAPSVALADLWDDSCNYMTVGENPEYKTLSITVFGPVNPELHRQVTTIIDTSFLNYPDIETLKLNLSSLGGDIDAGVALRNYLIGLEEQYGTRLIAHNIGDVSSAAIDIFCAASERYASPNTVFLVHNSQGEIYDQEWDDLDNLLEQRELEISNSIDIFTACTGMESEQAKKLYSDDTTFGPDQALDFGLIKEVKTASFDKNVDINCKLEIPYDY